MDDMFKVRSLPECLKDGKRIEIPLIQRDYAQGRITEAEKRRSFLRDLKAAIDSDSEIVLDYVYGNETGDTFYPLDGQQRLTTLWLVHWYVAFRQNQLESDDGRWLRNFTYKVRFSSTEFCRKICEMTRKDLELIKKKDISVAEYILMQPWFYSKWIQDPTIDSMLRTISGEGYCRGEDSCEGVFEGSAKEWHRLAWGNKQKIKFNILKIDSELIPDTDSLYVKMNSRGKRLSDYENFKSDLVEYIKKNDEKITAGGTEKKLSEYYPMQFDNDWTDALWKCGHKNGEIDDIYFALMNRLFFNELVLNKGGNNDDAYKRLYLRDRQIEYSSGFALYSGILDGRLKEVLQKWDKLLRLVKYYMNDLLISIQSTAEEDGEDDGKVQVSLIPSYDEYDKGKAPTLKDRVYLLAVSEFVSRIRQDDIERLCDPDDEKRAESSGLKTALFEQYRKWMRVTGNIIENAAIDDDTAMLGTMRLISAIAGKIDGLWGDVLHGDIYEIIKSLDPDKCEVKDEEAKKENRRSVQLEEEIEKAKIIADGWLVPSAGAGTSVTAKDREQKIIAAEKHAFFNGMIRFLLTDGSGSFIRDEVLFDTKFSTCRDYFTDSGASEEARREFRKLITDSDMDEICRDEDMSVTSKIGYNRRGFSWKRNILGSGKYSAITDMLLQKKTAASAAGFIGNRENVICRIDERDNTEAGKVFTCDYYEREIVLRRKYTDDFLFISDQRKQLCDALSAESSAVVRNECIEGYYFGKTVSFSIKGEGDYIWKVERPKPGSKCVNHIYRVEDGEESLNYYNWEQADALIGGLEAFSFTPQKTPKL